MKRNDVLRVVLVFPNLEDTSSNSQRESRNQVKSGTSTHQRWQLGPQNCEKPCFVMCFNPTRAMFKIDAIFNFNNNINISNVSNFVRAKNIVVGHENSHMYFTF